MENVVEVLNCSKIERNDCVGYFTLFNAYIVAFAMRTMCFQWIYKWEWLMDIIQFIIKRSCCTFEFDVIDELIQTRDKCSNYLK